jgi:hypothetical protein
MSHANARQSQPRARGGEPDAAMACEPLFIEWRSPKLAVASSVHEVLLVKPSRPDRHLLFDAAGVGESCFSSGFTLKGCVWPFALSNTFSGCSDEATSTTRSRPPPRQAGFEFHSKRGINKMNDGL